MKRDLSYLDETYIHTSHTVQKTWYDETNQGLTSPISKGNRLIIVHAGGEFGFINNALLIYKSSQSSGDYHNEMNGENFQKWMKEKLIPNLPCNSVIVMDNTSYHNCQTNKMPNSSDRKDVIKQWLTEKNIPFHESMLKTELYELVRVNKPKFKTYYCILIPF